MPNARTGRRFPPDTRLTRGYGGGVTRLRHHLRHRPALAALLIAAALALRVLVPAGFMPVLDQGRIIVSICSGSGPMTMAIAMPGMAGHDDAAPDALAGKACAFADLALPALGGADPVLLAAAIAFVLALGLARVAPPPATAPLRLRPPLRGPPRPA